MTVAEVAERLADEAEEELEDDLLAVGWYSRGADDRTGTIYLSGEFSEHDTPGHGVLESALLESIGHEPSANPHRERLTTTVRMYETIVDVDVHLDRSEGIVVAVRRDGDYQLDDLLGTIEKTVDNTT